MSANPPRTLVRVLVAILPLPALPACAPLGFQAEAIWAGPVRIEPLRSAEGTWGVRIRHGGRIVARVTLGPQDRWVAKTLRTGGDREHVWLELRRIDTAGTGGTPGLGEESFVRVSLSRDRRFPRVDFALAIESFDKDAWQEALQPDAPLYYLRCAPRGATMFYQGGMLIPSTQVDPFPLSRQGKMAGEWSPGWSYAPAMAAWAVPAVGLWDHKARTFVAYDFGHARHTDRSSKYIASAYCEGIGDHAGPFFALICPYQELWTRLTYPRAPLRVRSHFEIVYALDLGPDRDPNMFVLRRFFAEHGDVLPPVERVNDLGWIRQADAMTPDVGLPRTILPCNLIHKSGTGGLEGIFVEPGAEMLGNDFISDAVRWAFFRNATRAIDRLEAQCRYLMKHTTWMTIDGQKCCAWTHPMTGTFKEQWGGPAVRSVHHPSTWQIATAMLLLYEKYQDAKYLPYIDGVYNWTKHFLFTRNGVCDLPWAMFSRVGTAAAENFLLNYRRVFRLDPERARNDGEALRLATMCLYKVLWFYTADPDETDSFDPTFLNQAVNDKNWAGRVTWNEASWVLRTMVPIYCETGDPVLKYLLRGALERYWMGFREDGGITENVQIFGEIEPKGLRTGGFPDVRHGGNIRRYALPVGNAPVRVVVGQRAAIAFCKDTRDYDMTDYRCDRANPQDALGFTLVCLRPDKSAEPIDLIVTAPFRDLRGKGVFLDGQALPADRYEYNEATDGEDVYIWSVRPGQRISLGRPDGPHGQPGLDPAAKQAWYRTLPRDPQIKIDGFVCLNLARWCQTPVDRRWGRKDSWAGLVPGWHWAYGVPFFIVDPQLNDEKAIVQPCPGQTVSIPVAIQARTLLLFFGVRREEHQPGKPVGKAVVHLAAGRTITLDGSTALLADITNRMPLRTWDLYMVPFRLARGARIERIELQEGRLLAVTLVPADAPGEPGQLAFAELRRQQEQTRREQQRRVRLARGYALCLRSRYQACDDYAYTYLYVVDRPGLFTIPPDAYLEYEIFIPSTSASFSGGVDLTGGTVDLLRDRGISDAKGPAHPGAAPAGAKGHWCQRRLPLARLAGETFRYVVLGVDGRKHDRDWYEAFFKDIRITDQAGKTLIELYMNEPRIPCGRPGVHALRNMKEYSVTVVPAPQIKDKPVSSQPHLPAVQPPEALNPDCSLEQGLRYWQLSGQACWTRQEVRSGRTAVDLSIGQGEIALLQANASAAMAMGIRPRQRYLLRFWAKSRPPTGRLHANLYGGDGYDFAHATIALQADGKWHEYRVQLETGDFPVVHRKARVFSALPPVLPAVRIWTLHLPQRTFVDDVALTRLGPPATKPASAATRESAALPLLFEDDFEQGRADRWEPTDPDAWAVIRDGENLVYALHRQSDYQPPVRSPRNISLIRDLAVADFVLELRIKSTTKDYPHRDMCIFFGWVDPTHFYYVHLGKRADAHSNSIFIVNGAPRVSIAATRTGGTNWDDAYHVVRVVRRSATGRIKVYFDDPTRPVMTATDSTFRAGRVGVGSFDDTGCVDDVRLWGLPDRQAQTPWPATSSAPQQDEHDK